MYQLSMDEVLMLLYNNNNYLILTHKKPDGDTLGSASALCKLLREKGKTAYLLGNEEMGKRFDEILRGTLAPECYKADFVISVDVADVKLLPANAQCYAENIVLGIDHHPTNTGFAGHTYLEADAAATGEIIYKIMLAMGIEATKDIMTPVYIAVSTDTGCFRYSNTTAHSHIVAAKAIEVGVDMPEINKVFFETKSMARIAVEANIYDNIQYFYDNKVAFTKLSRATIDDNGATEDDLDNISSILRKIEGIECGITATEQPNGDLKISVRSGEKVDGSLACKVVGGGGHKRAAGATIAKETAEEDLKKLIEAVGEQINA
ncbi:MAG: DHH family phosphoesterase [Clostridia bacterium]|nr:DHH family phosphoesterase [Clostridia bacterium]